MNSYFSNSFFMSLKRIHFPNKEVSFLSLKIVSKKAMVNKLIIVAVVSAVKIKQSHL